MDGAEGGREEGRQTVEGRKVPPPRIFIPDAAVVSYIAGKNPTHQSTPCNIYKTVS